MLIWQPQYLTRLQMKRFTLMYDLITVRVTPILKSGFNSISKTTDLYLLYPSWTKSFREPHTSDSSAKGRYWMYVLRCSIVIKRVFNFTDRVSECEFSVDVYGFIQIFLISTKVINNNTKHFFIWWKIECIYTQLSLQFQVILMNYHLCK